MSKLIFPKHGGVLVNNDAKVVRTVTIREKGHSYVVKIVRYHPGTTTRYVNAGRPYGYHYLDEDGAVTGSNSGNSHTIAECLEKAARSIRENLTAQRAAARTPSQKKRDRYRANVDFFRKHGSARNAEDLARAEQVASENDWTFTWDFDPEPYELGDDEQHPNEVLTVILKDNQGNVLASLGGIADPSREYRRVVEADLAAEALTR
jgi:hypothetical protein